MCETLWFNWFFNLRESISFVSLKKNPSLDDEHILRIIFSFTFVLLIIFVFFLNRIFVQNLNFLTTQFH